MRTTALHGTSSIVLYTPDICIQSYAKEYQITPEVGAFRNSLVASQLPQLARPTIMTLSSQLVDMHAFFTSALVLPEVLSYQGTSGSTFVLSYFRNFFMKIYLLYSTVQYCTRTTYVRTQRSTKVLPEVLSYDTKVILSYEGMIFYCTTTCTTTTTSVISK